VNPAHALQDVGARLIFGAAQQVRRRAQLQIAVAFMLALLLIWATMPMG